MNFYLQMFRTKKGTYSKDSILQCVKDVYIPIVFTSDGHLDKLYLHRWKRPDSSTSIKPNSPKMELSDLMPGTNVPAMMIN